MDNASVKHFLKDPDTGWQEGFFFEAVDRIRQKESVLFQKLLNLHCEFFCGEMIRDREVIEGILSSLTTEY